MTWKCDKCGHENPPTSFQLQMPSMLEFWCNFLLEAYDGDMCCFPLLPTELFAKKRSRVFVACQDPRDATS